MTGVFLMCEFNKYRGIVYITIENFISGACEGSEVAGVNKSISLISCIKFTKRIYINYRFTEYYVICFVNTCADHARSSKNLLPKLSKVKYVGLGLNVCYLINPYF